uniref:Aldo_ket_red domain-containing protein n=1 Tax=Angiostrongylus cantonensis TaxID=6313 RepID=A0A158P8C2_ANGCA
MAVETTTLSNGASMPLLGLGTWQAKDEHELTISLKTALDHGYRLIDTAFLYQNEAIIGKVLNEYISSGKIKREDLFITTKLPFTAHAADDVAKCVEIQLQALQLNYIDLYLIHCPCPFERKSDSFLPNIVNGVFVPTTVEHMETWRALEKLHSEGKLKACALGLSNFNAEQVELLYKQARVKPANLQVECHLYWPQDELRNLCKKLNISFTAYAPLGSPGRKVILFYTRIVDSSSDLFWAAHPDGVWPEGDPMTEPIVKKIAAKHKITAAQSQADGIIYAAIVRYRSVAKQICTIYLSHFQVLLRHLTQHGISAIPKSISPDRYVE